MVVEERLTDAVGRPWSFVDKEPIFTSAAIDATTELPVPGGIRCRLIDLAAYEDGAEVVTIDTSWPDHLESGGVTTFDVLARDVVSGQA